MKLSESVEEFFETKNIKNYQKERVTLMWMAAISAASGLIFGFFTGKLLMTTNLPVEIRIAINILISLVLGLFFTYNYKITRVLILLSLGAGIISPVIYLIWKSGIF